MLPAKSIFCILFAFTVSAQVLPRPRVIGLAHVAFFAHDFDTVSQFYTGLLGFEQPFGLPTMKVFKINDTQFIEISPEHEAGSDRLSHYALQVEDAEAMRAYLIGRGVTVPVQVPRGKVGNLNFMIHDPQGRAVEIVQYPPDSMVAKTRGQFLPPTRISDHMRHVGFVVTKLDEEMDFYTNVLGFREIWRGSSNGTVLSWINLKVPDGDDYIELMLYKDAPPPDRRGSANHLCLLVDNVAQSANQLKARDIQLKAEPKVGVNRKRQLNLFDADGSRTELMELQTIDGKPAPSSTAAPPN